MALGTKIPQLKGFEQLYKRDYSQPGRVLLMYNAAKDGDTAHQFRNDPLHWCLLQLAADPEIDTVFGMPLFVCVDEICLPIRRRSNNAFSLPRRLDGKRHHNGSRSGTS